MSVGRSDERACNCIRTISSKSHILPCQAGSIIEKSYPREDVVKMYEVQMMGAC